MNEKESFQLKQVSVRIVPEAPLYSEEPIKGPADAVRVIGKELCDLDREVCCVINLRSDGAPINFQIASIGALNQAIVHPRELMKSAILSNAANMILLHLHPSGSLIPSIEDIRVTDKMIQVCDYIGIELLDHVIIGKNPEEFYSFRENDILSRKRNTYVSTIDELKFKKTKVRRNMDLDIEADF